MAPPVPCPAVEYVTSAHADTIIQAMQTDPNMTLHLAYRNRAFDIEQVDLAPLHAALLQTERSINAVMKVIVGMIGGAATGKPRNAAECSIYESPARTRLRSILYQT